MPKYNLVIIPHQSHWLFVLVIDLLHTISMAASDLFDPRLNSASTRYSLCDVIAS